MDTSSGQDVEGQISSRNHTPVSHINVITTVTYRTSQGKQSLLSGDINCALS